MTEYSRERVRLNWPEKRMHTMEIQLKTTLLNRNSIHTDKRKIIRNENWSYQLLAHFVCFNSS